MRVVSLMLLLISASKADYSVRKRCSNSSQSSLSFEPSMDGVEGRYNVEWCTKADNNVTEWELLLNRIESRSSPEKCQKYMGPPGLSHSRLKLPVTNDLNCSNVCVSTFLDLIYNGTCYYLKTIFNGDTSMIKSDYSVHYILNNYTKEHFTNSVPLVNVQSYEGNVELHWYLGYIPATDYSVDIVDKNHTAVHPGAACEAGGPLQSEVRCVASLSPGCYTAYLTHRAPWTASISLFGRLDDIEHYFCHSWSSVSVVQSSAWWGWGEWGRALCAGGLVLLLAGLLLWTLRKRLVSAWKRRVRDRWVANSSLAVKPPVPPGPPGVILLLYARDCPLLERAAERLRALLQAGTGCQVLDLYSSSVVRLWARSGAEWLRLVAARADTRLVLLQTPAGVLQSAELAHAADGPALGAPLLPSRACSRRPHPGDCLLPLALRLMTSTPLAPPARPYTRHYVASIGGVEADMAPTVTPLRRYVLPEAAGVLLGDLAPTAEREPRPEPRPEPRAVDEALRQFTAALRDFTEYVSDNPDYLTEELIFK